MPSTPCALPDFRCFAYFFIALGTALSFVTAMVPFFTSGYVLRPGVLLAGLLPYVVYGSLSNLVRGWPLLIVGIFLLIVDLLIKIPERFLRYDGYADGLIYYWPLTATLAVSVVLGFAAKKIRTKPAAGP